MHAIALYISLLSHLAVIKICKSFFFGMKVQFFIKKLWLHADDKQAML